MGSAIAEVKARILYAQLAEGARCFAEGVLADVIDGDLTVDDWFIGTTRMDGGIPPVATSLTRAFPYDDLDALRTQSIHLRCESWFRTWRRTLPAIGLKQQHPPWCLLIRQCFRPFQSGMTGITANF